LKDGQLTLEDEFYHIKGWDPSELERSLKHLYDIFDRHGTLFGAFDGNKLIAISALESAFIGRKQDQLQLISIMWTVTIGTGGLVENC